MSAFGHLAGDGLYYFRICMAEYESAIAATKVCILVAVHVPLTTIIAMGNIKRKRVCTSMLVGDPIGNHVLGLLV
jgi:hypothetical protein